MTLPTSLLGWLTEQDFPLRLNPKQKPSNRTADYL